MVPGKMFNVIAAATLFGLTATPFAATASAQASCTAEMNRQDAALQQFGQQTARDANGFAADDAARSAFGDEMVDGVRDSYDRAKAILKGDPTAGAYDEFKEKWQEYQDYVASLPTMSEILGRASACFSSGAGDCLKELVDYNQNSQALLNKSSEASQKWVESLENDNLTKAAERVERARSVVQKAAGNAQNLASSAISGAMENCMNDFEQRVQNASNNTPVDLSNTLQPPSNTAGGGGNGGGAASGGEAAASGGGAGVGTAVGIGAAVAGAGAGAYYANQYLEGQKCNQYELETDSKLNSVINATNSMAVCTTQSCFNSRLNSVNSALTSLNSTLGDWCNCLGGVGDSLSSADKSEVAGALSELRSLGVGTGSLPACFR